MKILKRLPRKAPPRELVMKAMANIPSEAEAAVSVPTPAEVDQQVLIVLDVRPSAEKVASPAGMIMRWTNSYGKD